MSSSTVAATRITSKLRNDHSLPIAYCAGGGGGAGGCGNGGGCGGRGGPGGGGRGPGGEGPAMSARRRRVQERATVNTKKIRIRIFFRTGRAALHPGWLPYAYAVGASMAAAAHFLPRASSASSSRERMASVRVGAPPSPQSQTSTQSTSTSQPWGSCARSDCRSVRAL